MEELKDIRKSIDETDDVIKKAFVNRMELCKAVAEAKKNSAVPVNDPARENAVVFRLTEGLPENYAKYIKELYSVIFSVSKAYQSELIGRSSVTAEEIKKIAAEGFKRMPVRAAVACQGVNGAHSGAAANVLFPVNEVTYFKSFEGVFSAVESGLCEYGVLPVENSTAGSVTEVYDLMKKHDFHIVRAVKVKIEHCIAAVCGTELKDIKRVISHPQAIKQCARFLKESGFNAEEETNTAVAAKRVAEEKDGTLAVLCSAHCAETYGLKILRRNVQDEANNYTRFICIGKKLEIFDGSDKISVMTALPHRPGGLVNVLNGFAAQGLNLTKIESRPVPNTDFEFMFYFDFEGEVTNPAVIDIIASLENNSDKFLFLGAYKEIS